MKLFIQLVADYGVGDPAFGEVIQKLKVINSDIDVFPTAVPAFSTLATGFWIAQYSINTRPESFIIYSNTAPRKDTKQRRYANEGEKFAYALLDNGCKIAAVNAEYCFSFIKHRIQKFKAINIPNKGSQFRSRDFYPEAVLGIANENDQYLGVDLDIQTILDVPKNKLAFFDGYGNMKTTIKQSETNFTPGDKIKITLNGVTRMAFYADGNFAVKEGELAFAPGSSGEKDDRYMEVFLRGGSAHAYFEKPYVNKSIKVSQA